MASDRMIWRHRITGEIRIDDYVAETVAALTGAQTKEDVIAAIIAENRLTSAAHAEYDFVGLAPAVDLPWERGAADRRDASRRYVNLRGGARWESGEVVIDIEAAKAALVALVAARGEELLASDKNALRLALGEVAGQEAATMRDRRRAIMDLPAQMATELAGIASAEDLAAFHWPAELT